MGWDEVQEELMELMEVNISDSQDQIVADFNCAECGMGVYKGYYPLCYLCKVTELEFEAEHREKWCGGCFWCISPAPRSNEID